jgi:hypothetical protein
MKVIIKDGIVQNHVKVRQRLLELRISQHELSIKLKCHSTQISKFINGKLSCAKHQAEWVKKINEVMT